MGGESDAWTAPRSRSLPSLALGSLSLLIALAGVGVLLGGLMSVAAVFPASFALLPFTVSPSVLPMSNPAFLMAMASMLFAAASHVVLRAWPWRAQNVAESPLPVVAASKFACGGMGIGVLIIVSVWI